LTVRVPSDKLDEFVAFLGGVGVLESFSVSAFVRTGEGKEG